ncbi:hypothetical protein AB0C91_28640 [Streptomyces sp. NPDC048674]|uniref:hypothetical protein n=1 Tax=Streptomyces sp. NPDC048674 TaxID=3155491 RepID=UPI0034278DC7
MRDKVIVLHAMHWADEIRDPAELKPDDVKLTKDEIAKTEHLIDRLTRDEPPAMEEPKAPGRVVDLMAALQESVAKPKAARGEEAPLREMPEKKAAKKTAAKMATSSKKTAATKTAKKTSARKKRSA